MNLIIIEQKKTAPPSLKIKIAFFFRVHLFINMILLAPECVGWVEKFKIEHQIGAVEYTISHVAEKRVDPDASYQSTFVSHRIHAGHSAPVGKGGSVEHQWSRNIRTFRTGQCCRPAGLAVANNCRRIGVWMKFHHFFHKFLDCRNDIRHGLIGKRFCVKKNKINRMTVIQCHADF